MRKKAIVVVAFAALALVRWATPAGAQMMACAADREKFCSGVPMGGGRIAACLQEHAAQLSDACKTAMIAHAK
ncbi:MAG TPA: cysteine rich repeat-containing protein [Candidatus Eisenbacteria bacterium]|nr:cysteine rich repeat-containing protein [Candidatus Eisenbacteria bacterium]